MPQECINAVDGLIDRLLALEPMQGEYGPVPVELTFSANGLAEWRAFYDKHNADIDDAHGPLRSALSKLEAYCARFALVLTLCRDPAAEQVTDDDVRAASWLTEWFANEARRVYSLLLPSPDGDGDPKAREQAKLIDFIQRRGGEVTVRDVRSGCRWLRESGAAEAALRRLVEDGLCERAVEPSGRRGGRPREVFRLGSCHRNFTKPEKYAVSMTDDSDDTLKTLSEANDWGTI